MKETITRVPVVGIVLRRMMHLLRAPGNRLALNRTARSSHPDAGRFHAVWMRLGGQPIAL